MIDPVAVEQAWQGPWRRMTRKMRRFLIALAGGLGGLFWFWVPLQLLGIVIDAGEPGEYLARALLFFGIGLPGVTAAVLLNRMFGPEHRAEDALKREGARVAGQLLRSRSVPGGLGRLTDPRVLPLRRRRSRRGARVRPARG